MMHDEEQTWIIFVEEWRINIKTSYELQITEITLEFANRIELFIIFKTNEYDNEITLLIEQWTLTLHEDTLIIIHQLELDMQHVITIRTGELAIILQQTIYELEVTFTLEVQTATDYWHVYLGDQLWYWESWAIGQINEYEIQMNNHIHVTITQLTIDADYEIHIYVLLMEERIIQARYELDIQFNIELDNLHLWWNNWIIDQTLIIKTGATNKITTITLQIGGDTES
jgi:hypothetical protein